MTKTQKLKEKNKKLRKKLQELKSVIEWCLEQDWSYGNHGPNDVATRLYESINGKI